MEKKQENSTENNKLLTKVELLGDYVYNFFEHQSKKIFVVSLLLSIGFSIFKTLFYQGFNVDSYQYFALSIKKYLITGVQDYLFINYYARTRMIYPLIIAILHIVLPINVSILACIVNLVFALLSLFMVKKILKIKKYSESSINLALILLIWNYNFLNYWFNILTDFVGLSLFLLSVFFFFKFKDDNNIFDISYSLVFMILAILSRELYVFACLIYIYIWEKPKIRWFILGVLAFSSFTIIALIPDKIPFMGHFVAPLYWNIYINRQFIKFFLLLQKKWLNPQYTLSFVKGIIKVGILMSIIVHFLIDWETYKKFFTFKVKSELESLIFWFFTFFLFFTLFYSNQSSASGLRYWLPISWIPTLFLAKSISKSKIKKIIKITIITFFILYPLMWSSVEWYLNRNNPSGTGNIFNTNLFHTDMSDKSSISIIDTTYIKIEEINNSYIKTILQEEAFEEDSLAHRRARFIYAVWMNITKEVEIEISLMSPNDSYWGIGLYEVKRDYSPGLGELKIAEQYNDVNDSFQTFKFRFEEPFLLRYISLSMGGSPGSVIYWDYLKVKVI